MTVGFDAFYGTDAFPAYEYDWVFDAGGDIFQETSIQRTGAACIRLASNAGNGPSCSFSAWGTLGANGYYARIYYRFAALPASTVRIMQFEDSATFAPLVSARITSAGKLQLWNQTGTPAQIGSDSAATIQINTWYRIELHCKTVTGASDTAGLRLDGVEVASATGLALSDVNVGAFRHGWIDAPGASKSVYLDDMAVNDDTGSNQTSWPGDGKVAYLRPVSDNARGTNWTAGAGGTTNLWDAVDNGTPAGVAAGSATNTSQIKNTNTADVTGNYDANMESYTTAGIGATDTIVLVQSVAQVGTSAAVNVTNAIQIVSNPAQGAEETKTTGALVMGSYGTNWKSLWGAAQYAPTVVFATQPVFRIGRRGTEAAELHCCGMRIAVEYVAVGTLVGTFTDHPKPVLRGATL